jgi:diadenosine tetraphosphate (Ap4A) HIT family hydrolase
MAGIKRPLEVITCSERLEMPANSNVNVTEPAKTCPFCRPFPQRILIEGSDAMALWDRHPLNPGHVLLVPRRHVASWFEATTAERDELLRLADDARQIVIERHAPDGFNLGINDGVAAGQSVPHLHLHLIPRFRGDTPDPRGGVRWVIPDRAAYWNKS